MTDRPVHPDRPINIHHNAEQAAKAVDDRMTLQINEMAKVHPPIAKMDRRKQERLVSAVLRHEPIAE